MKELEFTRLSKHPSLYKSLISLIEEGFLYKAPYSFEEDFFPLIDESNWQNLHLLVRGEEILAHIGFQPRQLIHQNQKAEVVFIGGIVTKKDYQGQGLFKRLFQHSISFYNPALFMLWGNEESLYNKFNFYYGGVLYHNEKTRKSDYIESKLEPSLLPQVKDGYKRLSEDYWIVERTMEDWDLIQNQISAKLFSKGNDYYFEGKGKDLQGVIHESSFMNEVTDFGSWLPEPGDSPDLQPLGMIRLGDKNKLADFVSVATNGELEINEMNKQDIEVKFQDEFFTLDHEDFINGFFGPSVLQEFAHIYPKIFVSGLDSI